MCGNVVMEVFRKPLPGIVTCCLTTLESKQLDKNSIKHKIFENLINYTQTELRLSHK